MNTLQHSVVHRLPQSYRWGGGGRGASVEPLLISSIATDDDLVGLSLLSHHGAQAWDVMQMIKDALAEIQLDCSVVEWEGEPCLFVARHDECATTCRLKNFGVGIAEPFKNASA
ncbi:YejG family protein [Erwinia psidii]|uniref:Uncharacterized protein n=1 Tax=Erwinia psidii TaxID=69224 RepID=A0A3N6V428_9GAMM|nr:YejG family protein [Erwinia psidii]MCX8956536.1 hypothetical protein [Erwinia psidii]MCX8961554.1 hypothetical protein [Erwinia psidii]MCX8966782.1 hypothetical protein [Erwinia psidii]RQM39865.1 hypothetical protein EB241_00680 [Erwinia psidii]